MIYLYPRMLLLSFSTGQLIFALSFLVAFIGVMVWTYRRDKTVNRSNYKGVYKILVFIIALFVILYGFVKLKT